LLSCQKSSVQQPPYSWTKPTDKSDQSYTTTSSQTNTHTPFVEKKGKKSEKKLENLGTNFETNFETSSTNYGHFNNSKGPKFPTIMAISKLSNKTNRKAQPTTFSNRIFIKKFIFQRINQQFIHLFSSNPSTIHIFTSDKTLQKHISSDTYTHIQIQTNLLLH